MAEGNHSFTEQDIRKRFGAIVGHTVTEVDTAGVLTASAASRNKGRIGAVIEQSVLGYPADSDRRPDIVIDGQPWEVKATGQKESARGGWCAKEPMSITAVAPEGIVTESFSTSAFWHKAERLLVVYYLYVRPGRGVAVEYAGFEFKGYDLHTWREVDRCRLEADWTVVRDFVRIALAGDVDAEMPNLSTLINPQLLYLDTSPKWPNRPRFRLKASLVTQMARERLDDGMHMIPDQNGLSSMGKLKAHLHGISDTCAGRTLEDLATPFNLPIKTKSGRENKSLAEQVVVRLFTGHAGKISQVPLFAKAGLVFKTMTLTPTGGRTEDMKLNPSIDFDELCDPSVEFEDSAFAAPFIDSTMVVAVLEERYRDCPLRQCIFMGFKTLWLGTYLDAARALWDGIRPRQANRMARGKADFRVRREMLGLTQQDVADALNANVKTIKNWENPRQTRYRISDAAWEFLDCAADIQARQVAYARSVIEKHAEVFAESPIVVPITYYRDQAAYDECGRDAGPYGQANATSRAIARELERMGIQVEFRYADSADA